MDETNSLSDAEMRLITINGQTIMLEGDFGNMNMTNEFLNEMLMANNSKVGVSEGYNVGLNGNPSDGSVKELKDELTKLEISIQGDVNELETIQIGVEDAKSLGLYFCGVKNENVGSWENCTFSGVEDQKVKVDEEKVNLGSENCKVRIQSVPVLSVNCAEKDDMLVAVNESVDTVDGSENFSLGKIEKVIKTVQENNSENLTEIGHLEGFQIPTSEDGVLLPATVNARMADGSYQTITLVPQNANGTVTYTVHFSNLNEEAVEKHTSKDSYSESVSSGIGSTDKEITNSEINSVQNFLNSVLSVKNNQNKNIPDVVQKTSDKILISGVSNQSEESILKVNKNSLTSEDLPLNHVEDQLPFETKIDNLISENESVISKYKEVMYGKKVRMTDSDSSVQKLVKSNAVKARKVKFKEKAFKSNEEADKKKLKLSLLKPNQEALNKKKVENIKTSAIPHMNLNGRLEYPNLKAIDETAPSISYLKMKTSHATKQPYFNVLPYPKGKVIPVQKQILPLNCDLQQAKNIISLQKFLETQKLQLKIKPLVSNGNKIIKIRPKPVVDKDVKILDVNVNSQQLDVVQNEKEILSELVKENSQEEDSASKNLQGNLNMKDTQSDGRVNPLKFLNCPGSDSCEVEKETDCSVKLNKIFIKNSPEYFSQKVKDGKANEHPLGSSENPIQLVQTGHTFHSRQPLSEAQLRQIASILQKQKFDSPNIKKNSIFDPKTNTRIVYRVVYPEDVELKDADRNSDIVTKRKRGRHKTKPSIVDDENGKKLSPAPKGPTRGRPKKVQVSSIEDDIVEEDIEDTPPKKKIPRTRSGRLSRPPKYIMKDYRRLENSEILEKSSNSNQDSDEAFTAAYQNGKKVPTERSEKKAKVEVGPNLESDKNPPLGPPPQRTKRNFKPEYRCPTCQKIYLGHSRMMWHLNKFPDHCNVEKYKENYYRKRNEAKARRAAIRLNICDVLSSLSKDELTSLCGPILAEALTIWDFLLLRINLLKETRKDEVDALLHELVILLEKLTKIAEDIFLPVFTKEAEKDEDCIEIDRMEVAIALGLPVGFYKINNDNLNLLRLPLKNTSLGLAENEEKEECKSDGEELFSETPTSENKELFDEKSAPWVEEKSSKKLEDSFWLESKGEDGDSWQQPGESSIKTLSTKFEPNLSTKLLESSNDSIDDSKYEEPVQLVNLDSNSKDVDQSNSSVNMEESPEHPKLSCEKASECRAEEKDSSGLWNENSSDKAELWNADSTRGKWDENSGKSLEPWPSENSEMVANSEKAPAHLWNENSNLTPSEKVDETNSEFLDSLLSVPNSNEFLTNESEGFLSENISLMNKNDRMKGRESESEMKEKNEWNSDGPHDNYIRGWETGKNPSWSKDESILSERMPGVRTAARLTSTPETNGNISFNIPHRRNSISDFSNINLESANLDMVLPPAKTLIKDCLKDEGSKFDIKGNVGESFLENSDKNWEGDGGKPDLNVNSEELMKMALESLTSQHDVINVPSSSFDSAMGILNQSQESANLNLFTGSETDTLDFNLPLPEHLLRSNFPPENFQTSCPPNFSNNESPSFLSNSNNIFEANCSLSNSMKFDQFETNQKSKSLDDVMEFLETKGSFNEFEGCNSNESNAINNFPFPESNHREQFSVGGTLQEECVSEPKKKAKVRGKKTPGQKIQKSSKPGKKAKMKKSSVEYPKSNTIESIINEALFDSCSPNSKSLQLKNSSPNGNSIIPNRTENYSLPIIPESLDEVENLDFLNQD